MRASIFSIFVAILFTIIGSEVVATINGINIKKLKGKIIDIAGMLNSWDGTGQSNNLDA